MSSVTPDRRRVTRWARHVVRPSPGAARGRLPETGVAIRHLGGAVPPPRRADTARSNADHTGRIHPMSRKPLLLTTSLLVAAALAPGVAAAAQQGDVQLSGAPTLRVLNDREVGLQIATDAKIAKRDGKLRL